MLSNLDAQLERCRVHPAPGPNGGALRERDERLRAIRDLVGNLAHSVNNALAPLAGYINLLAEEVPAETPGSDYLSKFENSLLRAQHLMDAIQQATHPERNFLPKTTDLSLLLQRTTEKWMKALPATAQISVALDVVPCSISLDEGQWIKVIEHLLRNAESALDLRGSLHLVLRRQTLTPAAASELNLETEDTCQLVFEDSGCGMSEEVLKQACHPLFTTRPQGPAAGLGLTMVHSVVRLHGGQLAIHSTEGTGTTVVIWLPATDSASN